MLNNRQLEEQLEAQGKVIDEYEKASRQSKHPKQLSAMKEKIKNGDKHGSGFKLNQFQMKVYLDHSSPLHSEENGARRDRGNRIEITDRYEEGWKVRDRYERSDDKTADGTYRMSSQA